MRIAPPILFIFTLCQSVFGENEGVHVYSPVPGLEPSEFYSFRVRAVGSETWLSPHAFITRCVPSTPENDASHYYSQWIGDWSNTYINFEMNPSTPVEIEISKVGGAPIISAAAHPRRAVISTEVADGKAYVVVEDPSLFTIDIDGQMDKQDTGRVKPTGWGPDAFYDGPPIHTLTIFANPVIEDKPDITDPDVFLVEPGTEPPETGTWSTLYFKPGVHDVGKGFRVYRDKRYYIPGDAIVYGTLNNNRDWSSGRNIRIFGHGTLSGARIPHPDDDPAPAPDAEDWHYKPIDIVGVRNTVVEGITIADSAMHSLMLIGPYVAGSPAIVRWTKIFTWRANGDGINPFGNTLIEDCFIRTQDDGTYVNGHGIRRVTYWTDVNGSIFVLSPVGNLHRQPIVVEDCDVLYNRSVFYGTRGGRIFNLRGEGMGSGGENILFQNIRVYDPRPTRSVFAIDAAAPWQKAPDYDAVRGPGDIKGISFKNVQVAAPSIIGEPNSLWGASKAWLRGFSFEKVIIAGAAVDDITDFEHNEFVAEMQFPSHGRIMAFNDNAWSPGTGYSIDENGWIDTGAWAGWINVSTRHWIWSASTQSFLYLPTEDLRESGAWVFSPRGN